MDSAQQVVLVLRTPHRCRCASTLCERIHVQPQCTLTSAPARHGQVQAPEERAVTAAPSRGTSCAHVPSKQHVPFSDRTPRPSRGALPAAELQEESGMDDCSAAGRRRPVCSSSAGGRSDTSGAAGCVTAADRLTHSRHSGEVWQQTQYDVHRNGLFRFGSCSSLSTLEDG